MFDFGLDPFVHLERLLLDAKNRGEPEYNAMALATVGAGQRPTVRIVYFKGLLRGGLSFYCNYNSLKGKSIDLNNSVCANFYYPTRWEQIRIAGRAYKLTREENEAYFKTRPRLSQLGAWASNQSAEIPDREYFQLRLEEFEKSFEGQEIPCPETWGGYHLIPEEFEFWFGRDGRLHERFVYQSEGSNWRRFMRSP
ncbi:MAG: pyridoxamine 5'-phosphate oxidase [Bdellovibrionaceae bacterium]|nr:pyridoxamine 5'-phosphate oxidase [Pseudobdellovibrionaceae bacterium]